MAALTASRQRRALYREPDPLSVPAAAGATIWGGALVALVDGVAVPAANVAGQEVLGVSTDELDNSSGTAGSISDDGGERFVVIDRRPREFAVVGATPKAGQRAYVVDDDHLSADLQTGGNVAGRFLRPSRGGRWWVELRSAPEARQTSVVSGEFGDANTAGSIFIPVPRTGAITQIRVIAQAANSAAATGFTATIGAAAVTMPTLELANDAVAGDGAAVTPSAANVVEDGDVLEITTDGAGTGTMPVAVLVTIS